MNQAIERLRKAHASGSVTGIQIAEASGIKLSTVYDLLRYPEIDPKVSTAVGMARAAEALLGPES